MSAAGDTVQYNVDPQDLGVAAILQKPVDPSSLVKMLKTKLGME